MGILLYNLSNDFYNSFATVIDTEKTCVSTLCNSILKVKKKIRILCLNIVNKCPSKFIMLINFTTKA